MTRAEIDKGLEQLKEEIEWGYSTVDPAVIDEAREYIKAWNNLLHAIAKEDLTHQNPDYRDGFWQAEWIIKSKEPKEDKQDDAER